MKVRELISALQEINPDAEVAGEWFSPKQGEVIHAAPRRVVPNEDDPNLVVMQGMVEDRFEMKGFDYQAAAEVYPLLRASHTA